MAASEAVIQGNSMPAALSAFSGQAHTWDRDVAVAVMLLRAMPARSGAAGGPK